MKLAIYLISINFKLFLAFDADALFPDYKWQRTYSRKASISFIR